MAITKLEENLNTIENLPDSPTLEPAELKRKFDESSIKIKEYINEVLTVEIDSLVNQIKKDVNNKLLEDNKKKYYVGKIIMDTKNVNPATYLGFGTWQLWGSGRVPVGVNTSDSNFNTVEKTGGSKIHKHNNGVTGGPSTNTSGSTKLTVNQIPAHQHKGYYQPKALSAGGGNNGWFRDGASAISSGYVTATTGGGQGHTHTLSNHTHTIGDGSTIQPYITCYMWKRVS